MTSLLVVRRYADALYQESTSIASVVDDVQLIQQTLNASQDLKNLLKSPVVSRHQKSVILQRLFQEHVHLVTLRFLQLLIQRGREHLLSEILVCFQNCLDQSLGITTVHAYVYAQLSDGEIERLRSVLTSQLEGRVRLLVTTDPSLMGGIILKIGDMVYDGSVRHQLSLLHDRLRMQISLT
ncbi:MAG: ATP synthase F1 subunit delta [Bacteroidetes bacterium]|nr:ATP synthase F1 subunit delta [Bacteroidota bacterium]MCY4225870.1 ATP synthase F1 subunit delta [Bacteroidota bacterium]